jgi:uncharacterized protein involved in type VI secretion and phage assembly
MATGYGGTYKAVVVDNADPMVQNRLKVTVPDVGIESAWANAVPGTESSHLPSLGDEVLVEFEGGDSERPVWHRSGAAAPAGPTYVGSYRATVMDNLDPMQTNRLHVQVPDALGNEPVWATASPSLGTVSELPAVGSEVRVQFEGGDPSHPEWTGVQ